MIEAGIEVEVSLMVDTIYKLCVKRNSQGCADGLTEQPGSLRDASSGPPIISGVRPVHPNDLDSRLIKKLTTLDEYFDLFCHKFVTDLIPMTVIRDHHNFRIKTRH